MITRIQQTQGRPPPQRFLRSPPSYAKPMAYQTPIKQIKMSRTIGSNVSTDHTSPSPGKGYDQISPVGQALTFSPFVKDLSTFESTDSCNSREEKENPGSRVA